VAEASQGRRCSGLTPPSAPGAAPRLSLEQRAQLLELLSQGAEALGFQGEVWTQPRVATLIRDRFGVSYDPSQVGRILKASGWSRQKPVQRATQRDEKVIRQWREERWPQIKKGDRGGADAGSCRPVRFLSVAWNGKNLCPSGPDSCYSCSFEPRPSFCYGRHHPRRQAVPDGAGESLPRAGCSPVPRAPEPAYCWEATGFVGWGSYPPQPGSKELPVPWWGPADSPAMRRS
jgi:transposase